MDYPVTCSLSEVGSKPGNQAAVFVFNAFTEPKGRLRYEPEALVADLRALPEVNRGHAANLIFTAEEPKRSAGCKALEEAMRLDAQAGKPWQIGIPFMAGEDRNGL